MNLMGVIGLQIKGFTIQNFEAVAFTQVTFNIKRLDVETCLANIFHLQKKINLELISKHREFLNFVCVVEKTKTFGKIEMASAIFWDYLGMFREYGQKNIFLGIKLFCFSR